MAPPPLQRSASAVPSFFLGGNLTVSGAFGQLELLRCVYNSLFGIHNFLLRSNVFSSSITSSFSSCLFFDSLLQALKISFQQLQPVAAFFFFVCLLGSSISCHKKETVRSMHKILVSFPVGFYGAVLV
jgi:hypothetical protein